jgi:hypothetical protein
VSLKSTEDSGEHAASIFSIEDYAKKEISFKQGLLFVLEYGCMYL